jgi:ligand-binding sensor domain-containing protein
VVYPTVTNELQSVASATKESVSDKPPVILKETLSALLSPTPTVEKESAWKIVTHQPGANQIRAMLFDQSGNLWAGGPDGLVRWDLETGAPTIYVFSADPETSNVVALAQTTDGSLWVGTYGHGLFRFDGKTWQKFTTQEGLPGNYTISLSASKNGKLWVDTYKNKHLSELEVGYFGLFDGQNWFDGIGGGFLRIAEAPNGMVWGVSRDYGITMYNGTTWSDSELANETITAMTIDTEGKVWLASSETLFRFDGENWIEIAAISRWIGNTSVSSIAVVKEDIAWLGLSYIDPDVIDQCGIYYTSVEEMGAYRFDGKVWTHFTTEDGLVDNKICDIETGPDGTIWFGSFNKGISHFDGSAWVSYVLP